MLYPSNRLKNTHHFQLFITLAYKTKQNKQKKNHRGNCANALFPNTRCCFTLLIGKAMLSIMSIISDAQKRSFILKFHFQKHSSSIQLHKKHTFWTLKLLCSVAIFLLCKDHSLLAFIPSVSTSKGPQNILHHLSFICQGHFVPLIFTKQKSTQFLWLFQVLLNWLKTKCYCVSFILIFKIWNCKYL